MIVGNIHAQHQTGLHTGMDIFLNATGNESVRTGFDVDALSRGLSGLQGWTSRQTARKPYVGPCPLT